MKKFLLFSVILFSLIFSGCFLDLGTENIDCDFVEDYEKGLIKLTKGCNHIDIPEGKTLYTLTLNMSDNYGVGSAKEVNISGTDFKGVAKGLIPKNPTDEAELKTTRTDVYICENGWGAKEVGYLEENISNRILYYIETDSRNLSESPLEYTANDGTPASVFVDYKNGIIPRLNGRLNYNILEKERKLYDMKDYDVDGSTYFHVVFNDFGENSAKYTHTDTSPGAYGTSGAYVPMYLRSCNKADMFFINTRFIDILIKDWTVFLRTTYKDEKLMEKGLDKDGLYDYTVSTIFGVFIHEYFHYLMDSYLYIEHKKELLDGPLFWIEGMAESASYLIRGAKQAEHSGFVQEWLSNPSENKIKLSGDCDSDDSDNCINYAVAPMFFLFLKEKYGMDKLKEFAKYSNPKDDLNTIVYKCTGESFGRLYKNFIFAIFTSLNGTSKQLSFLDDWSITKDNLAAWCCNSKCNQDLNSGCFSLVRWDKNPSVLDVQTDCDCYAFFL